MPTPTRNITLAMLHSVDPEATITVTFSEKHAAEPADVLAALRAAERDIEVRGRKAMTAI